MKIVVCLKAVPGYVTKLQLADTGDRIDYQSGSIMVNESDEYALEEALVLKERLGGEVTVITAGRLSAQHVLHIGLAKGADRAVRVDAHFGDADRTAAALAEAITRVGYDLVLTGVKSSDTLAAEVGIRRRSRLFMARRQRPMAERRPRVNGIQQPGASVSADWVALCDLVIFDWGIGGFVSIGARTFIR